MDDRLHVRTQSHPHVRDAGPQKSLVEHENTPANVRLILFAELAAEDQEIAAPESEVGY